MEGNTPGSGFKATMTNEMLIEKIKQIADNDPSLAQWLSAAVGGVVNKVSGGSLNAGVTVSIYATKWNEFQNEPELFDQLNEIKKITTLYQRMESLSTLKYEKWCLLCYFCKRQDNK